MREARPQSPEEHLPLHPLEFQLLLSLMDGVAHTYRIAQLIEGRQPSWSKIYPTNLYRRIWKLAAAGLVEEAEVDGDAKARSRKYFALTQLGREVAVAEATRLRELLQEAKQAGIVPAGSTGNSS